MYIRLSAPSLSLSHSPHALPLTTTHYHALPLTGTHRHSPSRTATHRHSPSHKSVIEDFDLCFSDVISDKSGFTESGIKEVAFPLTVDYQDSDDENAINGDDNFFNEEEEGKERFIKHDECNAGNAHTATHCVCNDKIND